MQGSNSQRVSLWIDLDGDSFFDPSERLFSQEATKRAFGQVFIPAQTVQNTSLRLRIKADLITANGSGDPCRYPAKGNVKDFGFFALSNTKAPEARTGAYPSKVCDGTLKLEDQSLNVPTSWIWDFGNGNTSHQQHPEYSYASPGSYQLKLIAMNQYGSDTLIFEDSILVETGSGTSTPQCQPKTDNPCCGYGVFRFSTGPVASLSGQAGHEIINNDWQDLDYQDFSCTYIAEIYEGDQMHFNWHNQQGIDQSIGVWVDWNNDGVLGSNEKELTTSNAVQGGTFGSTTWVPRDAVKNLVLRVRVIADPSSKNLNDPCQSPDFGQVEDYGLIVRPSGPILDPSELPWCEIGVHSNNPCDDDHLFQARLSSNATTFQWDFGDGSSSTAMRPAHRFSAGQHLIQLIAQNATGTFIDSFSFSVGPCEELRFPIYDSNRVHSDCYYEVIKYPHFSWPGSSSTDMYSHKFEHPNPNVRYQVNFDRVDLSGQGRAVPPYGEFVVVDGLKKTDPELARVSYNADTSIIVRSSSNKMAIFCDNKLNNFENRFPFLDLSVQINCIDVAGQAELNSPSNVSIWPNPTSGIVHFGMERSFVCSDILGRALLDSKAELMNLSGQQAGIYFIRFENGETQRVILQD